jgi:phosphomevalonate kinase
VTCILASAPGKAVLSGEYAVLHGAPAICMAVNHRAIASVTRLDRAWHSVSAPGYSSVEGRFVSDGASLEWLQGEDEYKLVEAAWRSLDNCGDGGLAIELDTQAFFDDATGAKLGLGSSAALTVALAAALNRSSDVFGAALTIHRRFQSGAGSGVDIAASVRGGLLEYRMQGAQTAELRWPAGLEYRLVWTGVPASTAGKLEQFHRAGPKRSRDALLSSAAGMVDAWQSASGVLAELPGYVETLRQFSEDYNLGIFDAGHDKLVAAAQTAGLVYKPCGAGGGDVGILLGTRGEQLDEFLAGQPHSGCRILESRLETQGVAWEQL